MTRSLLVAACCLMPLAARAQARPSPTEAQALLQTRPDLVAQLRQRFVASGLTREQVHARLRAEGYPEDLLDPYLPGFSGDATAPGEDVFRAVRALGVVDDAELASIRAGQTPRASQTPGEGKVGTVSIARDTVEKAKRDQEGFAIFGLDLFRGATTQFESNLSGPVDANYRLGPGDRLVLILTGDVEASYSLDVTREGFIVVPQAGQIYVANLTMGQLETLLYTRLSRVYSGIRANGTGTTKFSVSVARLRSNQVFVIGETQRPGSYQVSSAGTALTALYAAGGPTVNGSLRQIVIRRGGHTVDTLDVYDYLLRGDASHDVRLENGDVVFVPVHGPRARIVGEVFRPATYELKPRESVADLIRYSGGFQITAERRHVIIERILPPASRTQTGRDRVTIDIASESFVNGTGPTVPVEDGDIVHVLAISEKLHDRIVLVGNVREPGIHALKPGMRIADAIRTSGGILPDTYLGELLLTRTRLDGSQQQLRTALSDTTGRVVDDMLLQEDDSITIYSLATFRPQRYVAIAGAVKGGGRFPYREGMTLRDLVLLASGVQESAYLKEAEIARLPENRAGGVTATTIRVPLDSTYLFERKPNGEYIGPPGVPAPAGGTSEVHLLPYDNVLILRQPNWELQRTVVLMGEVQYPGTYALVRKTERLSDIITRAGGLTDEAYPEATVFSRGQYGIGRVGVDLPTAMSIYGSADNLILREGDTVNVRQYLSLVVIRGAVNQPTTVAYIAGKGIDYYINAAGGPSRTADEDRAYVQQPNGKYEAVKTHLLRPASMPRPRPGAIVVVPERDPADKKDLTAVVAQVGQIVAGMATLLILTRR